MSDASNETHIERGDRHVSGTRRINADSDTIFDLLAHPGRHAEIDGSGMVTAARGGATRLSAGAKFSMDMKMGPLPYRITSTVKEFEEGRRIAWGHAGGHRWRYELSPVADDPTATLVTETFDWSTAKMPATLIIKAAGYAERHADNIAATLERLAAVVED